jgi:hypothetical protein
MKPFIKIENCEKLFNEHRGIEQGMRCDRLMFQNEGVTNSKDIVETLIGVNKTIDMLVDWSEKAAKYCQDNQLSPTEAKREQERIEKEWVNHLPKFTGAPEEGLPF